MFNIGALHLTAAHREKYQRSTAAWWRGPECVVTLFWLMVLSGTIALGATGGNLTLIGRVSLVLDIAVAPTAAASNLDLSLTQPILTIADVSVATNSPTGYRVTVRSNNASNGNCGTPCFYSTTTDDSLAFSFYRGGTPIGFTGDTGTFIQTASASGVGGHLYAAGLSYDGAVALLGAANNYSEILIFIVSIN
ncbi:MAG: hypothetical protein HQ495_14160 [Alphaproteobacteria bacterium]|nr:hypothetical protein [Alphaproteobacteria bacterium]